MSKKESLKRLLILVMSLISYICQVSLYAFIWFDQYATHDKAAAHVKVYFFERGHWTVIAIYAILLFAFYQMYGGLKIGYLKTTEVLFSQIFATVCVNVITYFQICLLVGNLVSPSVIIAMTIVGFIISAIGTFAADRVYRISFPPRKLLLIHGDRGADEIQQKFESRPDKFNIVKCLHLNENIM